MPLTKEQEKKIIDKIDEALKRKNKKDIICPVCGHTSFTLAGGISNIFITDKFSGGIVIGGPVLPNAPIICENCGNTLFLNTKILGINFDDEGISKEKKQSEDKKKEKSNG